MDNMISAAAKIAKLEREIAALPDNDVATRATMTGRQIMLRSGLSIAVAEDMMANGWNGDSGDYRIVQNRLQEFGRERQARVDRMIKDAGASIVAE